MRHHPIFTISTFAIMFLLALPAGSAAIAAPIQPGDQVSGICTLNFAFDGTGDHAGEVYMGTAAHCVDKVGQRMSTSAHGKFGTVVYMGDYDGVDKNGIAGIQLDFALIRVDAQFEENVNPEVKGHPGLPTGYTTNLDTGQRDVVMFSGYGMGFGMTKATREERVGLMTWDNQKIYRLEGPIIFGDSGGPVLHESGKALGVVNHIAIGGCCSAGRMVVYDEGATVQGLITELAGLGWTIDMRAVAS